MAKSGAAGWHEDGDAEGVEQGAEVERVAGAAVGAVGEQRLAVHGGGLHDAGADVGCAPDAEPGAEAGEQQRDDQQRDGGGVEGEPALLGEQRGEDEPGGAGGESRHAGEGVEKEPRRGEAEKVDDARGSRSGSDIQSVWPASEAVLHAIGF